MPHRDPETGQFVSDDGTVHSLCYNDHMTVTWSVEAENTGGNNGDHSQDFSVDLPVLDNDELAELAYLRAGLAVRNDPDAETSNTSPGTINAVAEIGANLDGEFIVQSPGDTDGVSEIGSETGIDFIQTTTGADDDHGHFAVLTATSDAAYQDTGSSTGGGGGMSGDRLERNFRQIYGEGPWLDATDDIEGRVWVNKNTTDSDARGHLVGQAVFRVLEDEHCRPSFGLRG